MYFRLRIHVTEVIMQMLEIFARNLLKCFHFTIYEYFNKLIFVLQNNSSHFDAMNKSVDHIRNMVSMCVLVLIY